MTSVLYVTTTFPTLAWFLENEVHELRSRGHRVCVITLRKPSRVYQPAHADLLEITRSMGNPLHPAAWFALLGWWVRRPGLLITEVARLLWSSRSSAYALAGHLAYLPAAARIARVVEAERIDHVHGAWAHFPGSVAYLVARLTRRPFSFAAHAGGDLVHTQAYLREKAVAARFVTTCVRKNAETLRALAGPKSRVVHIYHGVDLTRFNGAGRQRSSEPVLLTVGRLAPAKGFDVALRALALLVSRGCAARLVMVGDGPMRGRLEALARQLNVVQQVTFTGAMAVDGLLPLYRSCWLMLMPSIELVNGRRDGIPNVVVEAMAMGMPCAGSRAAGLEEVIVPGETGVLAAAGDAQDLADVIEPLLRDPARLDAMGVRARARVVAEFDSHRNMDRLVELLCESHGNVACGAEAAEFVPEPLRRAAFADRLRTGDPLDMTHRAL